MYQSQMKTLLTRAGTWGYQAPSDDVFLPVAPACCSWCHPDIVSGPQGGTDFCRHWSALTQGSSGGLILDACPCGFYLNLTHFISMELRSFSQGR